MQPVQIKQKMGDVRRPGLGAGHAEEGLKIGREDGLYMNSALLAVQRGTFYPPTAALLGGVSCFSTAKSAVVGLFQYCQKCS